MRIVIAALLGAIVLFVWQLAVHMFLPIGEMGMRAPKNESVVLQSVRSELPEPGIYMLPYLSPEKWGDEAAMNDMGERAKANPYAFVVVNTPPTNPLSMVPKLSKQFLTGFLAALIVSWLLAGRAWTFGMRVVGSTAVGVFGWLSNIVPLWNWYRFPPQFMHANLLEQGIGWLLVGLVIAWWLGRR
jgi:hypothetical protein